MKKKAIVVLLLLVVMSFAGCEEDNESPEANAKAQPDEAWVNETATKETPTITFNASASKDPDGDIVDYYWDFDDGNETHDSADTIDHTYERAGKYVVLLKVTDNDDEKDECKVTVIIHYHLDESNPYLDEGDVESHPFPVNDKSPTNGRILVNCTDRTFPPTGSDVTVTVYSSTDEVIERRENETVENDKLITIELDSSDVNDYGYGEYRIDVECTRGQVSYDLDVFIFYG